MSAEHANVKGSSPKVKGGGRFPLIMGGLVNENTLPKK